MGKDTKNVILNQKLSQRDAFWSEVGVQMAHDEDIVIVVVDMSTPVFDEIRVKYPHRFINVGIAEQNAISVAAGLAMKGKKVFVYAIASFMVLRCFEQIRVNCSIMGLPITIVNRLSRFKVLTSVTSLANAGPMKSSVVISRFRSNAFVR